MSEELRNNLISVDISPLLNYDIGYVRTYIGRHSHARREAARFPA